MIHTAGLHFWFVQIKFIVVSIYSLDNFLNQIISFDQKNFWK